MLLILMKYNNGGLNMLANCWMGLGSAKPDTHYWVSAVVGATRQAFAIVKSDATGKVFVSVLSGYRYTHENIGNEPMIRPCESNTLAHYANPPDRRYRKAS